jgi:hypothetical protein
VSDHLDEAVDLLSTRAAAEAVVRAWDRDESDQAGVLHVELIELEALPN